MRFGKGALAAFWGTARGRGEGGVLLCCDGESLKCSDMGEIIGDGHNLNAPCQLNAPYCDTRSRLLGGLQSCDHITSLGVGFVA